MAYNKQTWVDHDEDAVTGEVIVEGTPVDKLHLDHIEDGIAKAHTKADDAMTQFNNLATVATHAKSGIMHKLTLSATATEGLQQVAFMATAEYNEGDTWGVNGIAYTAEVAGEDGALPELLFVAGNIVSLTLDPNGKKLGFKSGGKPRVPDDFGDGSDGDLYIAAGETVVLPVLVPHQSVVEKQYKSVFIGVGATLKCSDPNAGLVIRCKGDCTVHGTIDQSLMAPKTNPSNNYPYPGELLCGAGGDGGITYSRTPKGIGMAGRPYGGGYSGGGTGTGHTLGGGGSSTDITVLIPTVFIGGLGKPVGGNPTAGKYGGGGGGHNPNSAGTGGNGGSGPGGAGGGAGGQNGGGGGGAGNIGGGVLLLYLGDTTDLSGHFNCNGGTGGNGGSGAGGSGAGGGGGGGGSIYICYFSNPPVISGNLNVNGGSGGSGGVGSDGSSSKAGTIGTVTIKKYVKGMPV